MDLEDGLKTEPLPTVVLDVAYHRAEPSPFGFAANTEGEATRLQFTCSVMAFRR